MSSGRDGLPPMKPGNGNLHLVLRWLKEMTGKGSTGTQRTLVLVLAVILLCASVAVLISVLRMDLRLVPAAVGAGSLGLVGIAGTKWLVGRVSTRRVAKSKAEQQRQIAGGSGGDGEQPADQDGDQVREGSA